LGARRFALPRYSAGSARKLWHGPQRIRLTLRWLRWRRTRGGCFAFQYSLEVFALERLIFHERCRKPIEDVAMLGNDRQGAPIGFVDQLAHLVIDRLSCSLRVCL